MSVHLYLDLRPGYPATRPVGVVLTIRRHRAHKLKITTPIRVAPREWSAAHERLKPSAPGATRLNGSLQRVKALAQALLTDGLDDEALRQQLKEQMGIAEPKEEAGLVVWYERFLEEKRARTKASTVLVYEVLLTNLKPWLEQVFSDDSPGIVGPTFLDDFASYLLGKGQANSTVNKLTTRLKGFLRWLARREVIDRVPDVSALPTTRGAVIYLTPDELGRLARVDLSDLSPGHAAARDLFVFQALTGQRYSDVKKLQWADLDLKEGGAWWNLVTEKTSLVTRVPLARPAREMIEARRGEDTPLPRLSNQKANAFLKTVCERAKIDEPITTIRQRGGVKEKTTRPKHEVIGTHTARKTFVTTMLHGGAQATELLGLTHSDLRTLKLYAGSDDGRRRKQVERIFGEL